MSSALEGINLGQYRLVERLGKGGMAEVYKAYQPSLDRYVAIKVLHAYFAEEEDFRNRFQREARAVARLRHPNIVQIYDFGVEGDIYYMAMEFLAGGTLKQRLRQTEALLPHQEVLRIVERVAAALDYAHARGIYHRDVKPANIMLTDDNQVILTDFGLAKMAEGSQYTRSGLSVGTPEYMAPEQGQGLPVDHRADVYSLGVVLYELLTGQLPYTADTPVAVIFKHIKDPLPLPRTINPALDEKLERVILKALAKSPADRYQSAGELAVALRQALVVAGEDLPTPPPAPLSETQIARPHLAHETPPGESPALPGESPALPGESPALPGESPALPGESPALPGEPGERIERGLKRALSRIAGTEPEADWETIGQKMEEQAKRRAARWAGVEGEEDWDAIGQRFAERIEDKAARHKARQEKGEKDEKVEPGRGGRRWFLIGCLAFILVTACCVCGICTLSNCERRATPPITPFIPTPFIPLWHTPAPASWRPFNQPDWGLTMRVPEDWTEEPLQDRLSEGVLFVGPGGVEHLSYALYVRLHEGVLDLATLRARFIEDRLRLNEFQQDQLTIGGEEAMGARFLGLRRQTGQVVRGEIWTIQHGDRSYVILYMAPESAWGNAHPVFQEMTRSIKFTG